MKRALVLLAACGASPHPFPLAPPFVKDTDLASVSIACRPDPTPKDPTQQTCAPAEYVSPFLWDQVDNLAFARMSRGFSVEVHGEARNANSMDEVADSSWFTNIPRGTATVKDTTDDGAPGACKPEDILDAQDKVADGGWIIDHGKDNGSTLGFRISVPGKGLYMLKADDEDQPERASAASVIGAAFFEALGFNTTCEQVVVIRKAQLKLTAGLKVTDNAGVSHVFDEAALDKVLKSTTQVTGGLVRMQASKWLPGLTIGPFRYIGRRDDDPNDVVDHADRRELRGSQVLAGWLDHWDAREQNSMDVWMADNAKDKRSSPGHVVHYILDTSDTLGGVSGPRDLQVRLGHSYEMDFPDIFRALFTFGIDEEPWDRAMKVPGREKFGFYTAHDFDPAGYKPFYPNPAFLRATERDRAWMARLIARFSEADIRRIVAFGQLSNPSDVDYLVKILLDRQHQILVRFLRKLSPIGEVHSAAPDQICATDFARLRHLSDAFHYAITERAGDREIALTPELADDGVLCFHTRPIATGAHADGDPAQRVTIVVTNGAAGPLHIHAYDLGARGMHIAGLTRPN